MYVVYACQQHYTDDNQIDKIRSGLLGGVKLATKEGIQKGFTNLCVRLPDINKYIEQKKQKSNKWGLSLLEIRIFIKNELINSYKSIRSIQKVKASSQHSYNKPYTDDPKDSIIMNISIKNPKPIKIKSSNNNQNDNDVQMIHTL